MPDFRIKFTGNCPVCGLSVFSAEVLGEGLWGPLPCDTCGMRREEAYEKARGVDHPDENERADRVGLPPWSGPSGSTRASEV